MKYACPHCHAADAMGVGKTKTRRDRIHRWRKCEACGHQDRIIVAPEEIIATLPVKKISSSPGTLTPRSTLHDSRQGR